MRPRVTLKLATSLDGKIALANGQSEWVTSEASRAHGRYLRAENDAIAVGANTAELDNPKLTTRVPGQPDPVRVVFDTRLRLSPASYLAVTAKETPTWVYTAVKSGTQYTALEERGVKLVSIVGKTSVDLEAALAHMSQAGIRSLLVEGGGTLIASFIQAGYFDILHWYRAPILLGADGRDCVGALQLTEMHHAIRLHRIKLREVGLDTHEVYERA